MRHGERENRRNAPSPAGPAPSHHLLGPSAFRYPRTGLLRIDPGSGLLDVDWQEAGGVCDCRTVWGGSMTRFNPLDADPHAARREAEIPGGWGSPLGILSGWR